MTASLPPVTPTPQLDHIHAAILDLFAIQAVADAELADYVAGEPAEARHVLALPRLEQLGRSAFRRVLIRDEPADWCDGLACAAGRPELIPALAAGPWPAVVTVSGAAAMLPKLANPAETVGTYGAEYLARDLYPLYAHNQISRGRMRYLFEAEVRAEATTRRLQASPTRAKQRAADTARLDWQSLRRRLPAPIRERQVGGDLRPGPSPVPLPLDPDELSVASMCLDGLMVAHREGWLSYRHPGQGRSYVVQLPGPDGGDVEREISQARVLAWLLGVADWYGRADLVAYRPGLG